MVRLYTVQEDGGGGGGGVDARRQRRGYNASSVINLFIPISLCMLLVVATANTASFQVALSGTYLYVSANR